MKKITSVGLVTILGLALATGSVQASVKSTTPESMPAMFAQLDAVPLSDAALDEVQGEGLEDFLKKWSKFIPQLRNVRTSYDIITFIREHLPKRKLYKGRSFRSQFRDLERWAKNDPVAFYRYMTVLFGGHPPPPPLY